jgi:hypothetical protein
MKVASHNLIIYYDIILAWTFIESLKDNKTIYVWTIDDMI